jgi:DNA-directed RNA polymerase subunit N (RpoN/RPB10)
MIIPVRCFTCGHVIADKWNYYVRRCKELEKEQQDGVQDGNKLDTQHFDKTVRQKVFEELGLERICCRRMLLGHVDLIDTI